MSNQHSHSTDSDTKSLRLAFFLNLGFTIIEIIGGLLTNSLAVLSDAFHDLGDSLSLGLAWYFQKISKKGRNATYTYGYRRFSMIGAILNSIILVSGSVFIFTKAIPRLIHVEEADPKGMMLLALLGIAVNGFAVLRLRNQKSQNIRVVRIHLMEDVLGWFAVLIGSITIYFTEWYQIDPILSMLISLYILYNVVKNLSKSMKIILQAIPDTLDYEKVQKVLMSFPAIESFHDLHLWSLDGEKNILTVHLVIEQNARDEAARLKQEVKNALAELDIVHCTLETESAEDDCQDVFNDD